jgi:hypothetical protein
MVAHEWHSGVSRQPLVPDCLTLVCTTSSTRSFVRSQTRFAACASQGEQVRLYLINTANTRIFNVAVCGARMKLVGGDSGRYEHETFVDEVRLGDADRACPGAVVD